MQAPRDKDVEHRGQREALRRRLLELILKNEAQRSRQRKAPRK